MYKFINFLQTVKDSEALCGMCFLIIVVVAFLTGMGITMSHDVLVKQSTNELEIAKEQTTQLQLQLKILEAEKKGDLADVKYVRRKF